jgi:hypothetical protein
MTEGGEVEVGGGKRKKLEEAERAYKVQLQEERRQR